MRPAPPEAASALADVTTELRTGRGLYRLVVAAPSHDDHNDRVLTLALERADGIERVVVICRVAIELIAPDQDDDHLLATLTPWVERDFEQVREAALKTIRSERKLHEFSFANDRPGPFVRS